MPFGESEKQSRRSLYKIDDPFVRLWFRVVAPHRGRLAAGSRATRLAILDRFWAELAAQSWEDLCRKRLPQVEPSSPLGASGPWGLAPRWWRGNAPEWDVVSESMDGTRLLLGEAGWSGRPLGAAALQRAGREVAARSAPELPARYSRHESLRALLVPETTAAGRDGAEKEGVIVVTADRLIGSRSG